MTLLISEKDQQLVNQLRIDLAQVTIDLAAIEVADIESRSAKQSALDGLCQIKKALDFLGIRHITALKCEGISYLIKTLEEQSDGQTQA
jgi:hypothetical protein